MVVFAFEPLVAVTMDDVTLPDWWNSELEPGR